MRIEAIDHPDDPRVDDYRGLKEAELLQRRGVFIAEGRLVVERLLSPRCPFAVKSMLLTPQRADELRETIESSARDPRILTLSAQHMAEVVGFRFHRGILAAGRIPEEQPAGPVIRAALEPPSPGPRRPLLVVLEDLVDLDNVGSTFRNAAALGARAILLSPRCADPLYRKAIRTSMGHSLLLPFGRIDDWPGGLDEIRAAGAVVAALTPAPGAVEINEFARSLAPGRPVALVAGTEGEGLSRRALDACDVRVRIDMAGAVDSLNVATAVAVALHTIGAAP